jgi:chromosome segregation ATPase
MDKMTSIQLMIDQLEARASALDTELSVLDAELQELSAKGRALSAQADLKREKSQHLKFASSNLKIVVEMQMAEASAPAPAVDPWGDAG